MLFDTGVAVVSGLKEDHDASILELVAKNSPGLKPVDSKDAVLVPDECIVLVEKIASEDLSRATPILIYLVRKTENDCFESLILFDSLDVEFTLFNKAELRSLLELKTTDSVRKWLVEWAESDKFIDNLEVK